MEKKDLDFGVLETEFLDTWYKGHNIIHEKCELYCDFFISLLDKIDTTYLGKEILTNEKDTRNHFMWCLNIILLNFEKEKIKFTSKNNLNEFLFLLFDKLYYNSKYDEPHEMVKMYFKTLFDITLPKFVIELESLTDIYKIMEQNLNY